MRNLTTSYFERKETKFVRNKTAIYGRNRSSFCLLFVKLARLFVFSSFVRTYHIGKRKAGACLQRKRHRLAWTTAEAAVRGHEPSTKGPSPQTVGSPQNHERLVVTPRSNARSFEFELLWASARRQFASARHQIETGPFFFVQTFVDFALSLPGQPL